MTQNLQSTPEEETLKVKAHLAVEPGARLLFKYQPRRRLFATVIEALAEALEKLPVGVQMRNIAEIEHKAITFWIYFDHLGTSAEEALIKHFQSVTLDIEAVDEVEAGQFYDRFPCGEVSGRLMLDSQGHELITLKVVGGWNITRPGMTRSITKWLLGTGHISYLILTAAPDRTPGLMHFDLAFVLSVQRGNLQVAAELAQLLERNLDVDIQCYRGKSASRHLSSLNPRSAMSRRPQHPGCIGNIADLFSI